MSSRNLSCSLYSLASYYMLLMNTHCHAQGQRRLSFKSNASV